MASKFDQWVSKRLGKENDFDGQYGAQCFDLFNFYANELFGVPSSELFSYTYAKELYTNFHGTIMTSKFKKIANTASFVPKKGDVMVWSEQINASGDPPAGHVAICTGEGDTSYFYSYDQNWNGVYKMRKINHNYTAVYGVLRPNDQSVFKDESSGGGGSETTKPSIGTILMPDTYIVNVDALNIRSSASTSASIVGTLYNGNSAYISEFKYVGNNTWGKISSGWICVNYDTNFYVNVYGTTSKKVNVLNSPGGTVKTTCEANTKLQFTRETNGWAYAPSVGGWINLAYVIG